MIKQVILRWLQSKQVAKVVVDTLWLLFLLSQKDQINT